MIAQSSYLDLLGVLAGATNGAHRRAASAVLARELTTRMQHSGRVPQPVSSTHPLFRDVPPVDYDLGQLLTATKAADESLAAARFCVHLDRSICGLGVAYVHGATAPSSEAMMPARANAERIAAQLRTLVVADIGEAGLSAARLPFEEQLDGFATTAWTSLGVSGEAAPGESYPVISGPGDPEQNVFWGFVFAGSGVRQIVAPTGQSKAALRGVASSASTSGSAVISLSVFVGETAALTVMATRSGTNPAEFVELGLQEFFRAGQATPITVSAGQRVSVRNTGAAAQVAGGALVFFR